MKIGGYTSRGHGCGFYGEVFLLESKALKQAHSELCNCFSNAAIGQKQPIENRSLGRVKYSIQVIVALVCQACLIIIKH